LKRIETVKLFLALLAFVAGLAGCATTEAQTAAAPTVYVMRHLQKAEGPDPALSAEGRSNAERLAVRLAREKVSAIYVSTTRRARETAAPLAQRTRIAVKEYDPANTAALVERVTAERGTVLVVGHSNTVPEIVERLGGTRPAPLADTDYGDLFRLSGEPRRTERIRL
jgi:phosphohistidine phosphatase SixA